MNIYNNDYKLKVVHYRTGGFLIHLTIKMTKNNKIKTVVKITIFTKDLKLSTLQMKQKLHTKDYICGVVMASFSVHVPKHSGTDINNFVTLLAHNYKLISAINKNNIVYYNGNT